MSPAALKLLLVAAWIGGRGLFDAVSALSTGKRKGLTEAWRRTAEACGLTDLRWSPSPIGHQSDLVGQSGGQLVRFQVTGKGKVGTRIVITDQRPGRAQSLTLRREDLGTALRKRGGLREIQIGDADFDQAVFIEGPPTLARAILDAETRGIVRSVLFEAGVRRSHGSAWLKTTAVAFEAGELRVDVDASSAAALGELLARARPDALRTFLEAARCLCRPDDIAVRLARTARSEPVDAARLQDLLTLAREFPEHAATRVALRAGLIDRDEEIRLRCAMALGDEGHDVLLALASARRVCESCSARAVTALHELLPLERAQKILSHALRARRLPVAAAALEVLGQRRTPEMIPTIAHVLRQEKGELAIAAARALATSGLPAAEPPLIEALGRDDRNICIAAAQGLGRVGSAAAILPLKDAMARHDDRDLDRATRQAIAEIKSRRPGATPGQLSLADTQSQPAGQLSLVDDTAGRLSLPGSKMEREGDRGY
jgi:hypothetical protein